MDWSEQVLRFVDDHKPNVSGALGTLISRQVLAGCSVSYVKSQATPVEADVGIPSYLPDIEDEHAVSLFITLAHGWPTDPFRPDIQPHLEWIRRTTVYLHWPERKMDWHWLLPMPESLPVPQQLNMAEYLYDRLPGDMFGHIAVMRGEDPLDITLERHDGETLTTVVCNDVMVRMRSREGMRVSVVTAAQQLDPDNEPCVEFN